MTCAYTWNAESLVKTFAGYVTAEAFEDSATQVGEGKGFDTLKVIYNDFSDVVGHNIDPATYARVAVSRLGASWTNANYRVAFIATGEDAQHLREAFAGATHSRPFDAELFSTLAEAKAWFALQPVLNVPRGQRQ